MTTKKGNSSKVKETTQNSYAAETSLLQRIESLEERLANIEASLPNEKVILLREISRKDAEKEIRKMFSKGRILYYSDIAEQLKIDLELVVDICNELQSIGEIEVVDDALQSR